MKNTAYADYPQGLVLPKENHSGIFVRTKAKSLVGIGLPQYYSAHRRQLTISAGFFMRTICTHFCNSLGKLHLNYGGLVEGASARRFRVCGKTNLDQSTTSRLVSACGGYIKPYSEAVIMTTTPTQAVTSAMIYTFIVAGGVRALSDFKRIRTISTHAKSEQEARHALLGLPLVFVSRTPSNAQEVAA